MDLGGFLPPPVININCLLMVGSLVLIPEGWQFTSELIFFLSEKVIQLVTKSNSPARLFFLAFVLRGALFVPLLPDEEPLSALVWVGESSSLGGTGSEHREWPGVTVPTLSAGAAWPQAQGACLGEVKS